MIPSDQIPPGPDWIMRRLADLERQVRELTAGRRLEASSISAGGVTVDGGGTIRVLHDDGTLMVIAGRVETNVGPIDTLQFRALDGTQLFRAQSNLFGYEDWTLQDGEGNVLVAMVPTQDGVRGRGLLRPYIPGAFASMSTPTDSTSSGTFTTLQKAVWLKQHPAARMWVLSAVTSTTAEIRWRVASGPDAGTVIGGPVTLTNGTVHAAYGPFTIPGGHMAEFSLDLEGRVASGAGSVAVRTTHAVGRAA